MAINKCPPNKNSTANPALAISDQPLATTIERRKAVRSRAPMAWPHRASTACAKPSSACAANSKPLSSSALAATVASPSRAPCKVMRKNTDCSIRLRMKMSRLTPSSGFQLCHTRSAAHTTVPGNRRSAPRVSHRPSRAPLHSAITEARAEPTTPQSSPRTNHRFRAMFTRLVVSKIASGARAFCVPKNQPTNAYVANAPGKPNRRVWKKSSVNACSSAEGCITLSATPLNGIAMAPRNRESNTLRDKPCNKICRNAVPSPRPAAWAAKPVVPMRKKPIIQARNTYRLAPTATAPN